MDARENRAQAEGEADYAPPAPPVSAAHGKGRLTFKPGLWATLLLILVVATCLSLGRWQWNKAQVKQTLQNQLDSRSKGAAILMPKEAVDGESLRFRHVLVRGEYEPARQIVIDNRAHGEQSGYHIVTPLHIEGSGLRVLVNRGWVPPATDRQHLPSYAPPAGTVEIQALATVPSQKFFTLGSEPESASWQTLWQNLDLARYRRSAGFEIQPVVLLLDGDQSGGYLRDWPRPDERIEKHLGYALQWLGFAIAAVAIWVYVNLKRQ